MKSFHLLISDAKDFMANSLNCLIVWVLLLTIASSVCVHFEIASLKNTIKSENQKLSTEIDNVRKRVDYRYFNTTRSLEDIYDIKINSQTGELKPAILRKADIQPKF